jgi:hypothetical protein
MGFGDRKTTRLPQPSGFIQVIVCNSRTVGTFSLAMVGGSSSASTAESLADVGREPTTVGSSSTPTAESPADVGREPTTVGYSSTPTAESLADVGHEPTTVGSLWTISVDDLREPTTGSLEIYVDVGETTTLCLDGVCPGQSVWSIKRLIQERMGLVARSPACVRLKNDQRVLKDMMSVSECGIIMGTTLCADMSRCRSRGVVPVVADVAEEEVMHAAACLPVVDPMPTHDEGVQIIVNTNTEYVLGLTFQPGHSMWAIKAKVLALLGLANIDPSSTDLYAMRDREKLADLRTVRACGINWGSHLYFDDGGASGELGPQEAAGSQSSAPVAKARAARQATSSRSRSR